MDVENKDFEQMSLFETDEEHANHEFKQEDDLRNAIEDQLSKIRNKSMILGFRVSCQTILDKINMFENSPGTKSNNDHKRLIKDIKKFVEREVSRENQETVQN